MSAPLKPPVHHSTIVMRGLREYHDLGTKGIESTVFAVYLHENRKEQVSIESRGVMNTPPLVWPDATVNNGHPFNSTDAKPGTDSRAKKISYSFQN